MKFNPIAHPLMLDFPVYTPISAWTQHVPFGMLLVDLLRPRTLVELGTHWGMSYCAFCQSAKALNLDCHCFAVDTWEGDEHSNLYGPEVFAGLKAHHDPLYDSFSTLIQSTFDAASLQFEDHSIDLLHIDGYHTYAASRHDFDTWLPKMSQNGVVLLHDINEYSNPDFGVWKTWKDVKHEFPNYKEFFHGHGLGMVAVGTNIPAGFRTLLEEDDADWQTIRRLFRVLGARIEEKQQTDSLHQIIDALRNESEARLENLRSESESRLENLRSESESRLVALRMELTAQKDDERSALLAQFQSQQDTMMAQHAQTVLKIEQHAESDRMALRSQYLWVESSRGVRIIKLARASRAVLRHNGPFSLIKHGVQWVFGKRGNYPTSFRVNKSR